MTRVAAEARSRSTAQWITDCVGPQRKYKSPRVRGLRRKLICRAQKSVAGRFYQLLSGHAAISPYMKDKIRKTDDDRYWWCGGGKKQTRHHLFTGCRA